MFFTSDWKKQFAQFHRIVPCLLTIIIDYMGYGLVLPLVTIIFSKTTEPIFREVYDQTLRNFYFGLTIALYPLTMFFGAAFLGDLSDRWGRKKVLLFAMAGIFFSFIFMTIGIHYHFLSLFLIGRGLSGLFAGSQPLAQAAVADVSTLETKALNMSLVSLTNVIALSVGPLIAAFLSFPFIVSREGYFLPFAAASLLALITFFWIWIGFKETYFPKEELPPFDWLRPLRLFMEAFKDRDVRDWMIIFLLFQLGVALYFVMSAILFQTHFYYSSTTLGLFYAYMGVLYALHLLLVYPPLLKKYSLMTLGCIGLIGMGVFITLAGLASGSWIQWVLAIFMTGFNIIGWTAALAYYSNAIPAEKQGWAMGVIASSVAIAFMLSGFASNLLKFVSVYTLLIVGGVSSICGGLLLWMITRKKRST
jgi:MFS transporter, DHA1 family, tetracycline resistance protein